MTDSTDGAHATTGRRQPQPSRSHAAAGARILVGGLAVGGGLAMVGAMAAAAQAGEPASTTSSSVMVRRVVVLDQPPAEVVVVADGQVAETVRAPAEAVPPVEVPAPQTRSGGS